MWSLAIEPEKREKLTSNICTFEESIRKNEELFWLKWAPKNLLQNNEYVLSHGNNEMPNTIRTISVHNTRHVKKRWRPPTTATEETSEEAWED